MKDEIWNIRCNIMGNFFLLNQDIKDSCSNYLHPSIRKINIVPELNEKTEQTGKFLLEIDYVIHADEPKLPDNDPANLGRDIFNLIISILTFLSGYPIKTLNPPSFMLNYPEAQKEKHIYFPEYYLGRPPAAITASSILAIKINSKLSKILAWFRKGIEEDDVINSIYSLFISLEILSNQFECPKIIKRACENCGYQKVQEAGMRQKVEYLLVNLLGYKNEQYERIWQTRNELSHGGFNLSSEEVPIMHDIKQNLILAIVKGVKKLLNIDSSDLPDETQPPRNFCDPVLFLEIDTSKRK